MHFLVLYAILVFESHHSKLEVPYAGETTTIIPTFVLNAIEFYGQLGPFYNGLEYFQQQLNSRRSYSNFFQYTQMPGIISSLLLFQWEKITTFDYTLVGIKYLLYILIIYLIEISDAVLVMLDDASFYRAKVLSITDKLITVNIC